MSNNFNISSDAKLQIKNTLNELNFTSGFLRLGVKSGGCSGFEYIIKFENNLNDNFKSNDLLFKFDDVNIVIDNKSMSYLNNSILEWKNSLMKKNFWINNPNSKSTCGCGKSVDF